MRARFKCTHVVNFGGEHEQVNLEPVSNDSEANKEFSRYTPSGRLVMDITNPNAIGYLQPKKEYAIAIRPVHISTDEYLAEGQKAYERYRSVVGNKNFQGNPMPDFEALTEEQRNAWAAAADIR